jgi:hypothetical protein
MKEKNKQLAKETAQLKKDSEKRMKELREKLAALKKVGSGKRKKKY